MRIGDAQHIAQITDEAIERAAIGAENALPGWHDNAYRILCEYIQFRGFGARFQIVEVRKAFPGFPDPPEARAWGAVARRAAANGLIEQAGYAKCVDPRQHGAATTVWRVVSLHDWAPL